MEVIVPSLPDLAMGVPLLGAFAIAYLIGSIPFSYVIAKAVTGEDITEHGTGNVGAMNVKRTTGSWGWFTVAMVADGFKGLLPTLAAVLASQWLDQTAAEGRLPAYLALTAPFLPQAVVLGTVVGHDFSLWLSFAKRRLVGGKGLATGGGALLAYDPWYFLIVLVTGLGVIALTRYMMAGQVAATLVLPAYTILTGRWDWPFITLLGVLTYARHHRRFMGLLRGEEPRLYVHDRMGPRG